MRSHPGGEEHTRRMLKLAELAPGASVLDLGAGAGEAVALLRALGYKARGIDRAGTWRRATCSAPPFPTGASTPC